MRYIGRMGVIGLLLVSGCNTTMEEKEENPVKVVETSSSVKEEKKQENDLQLKKEQAQKNFETEMEDLKEREEVLWKLYDIKHDYMDSTKISNDEEKRKSQHGSAAYAYSILSKEDFKWFREIFSEAEHFENYMKEIEENNTIKQMDQQRNANMVYEILTVNNFVERELREIQLKRINGDLISRNVESFEKRLQFGEIFDYTMNNILFVENMKRLLEDENILVEIKDIKFNEISVNSYSMDLYVTTKKGTKKYELFVSFEARINKTTFQIYRMEVKNYWFKAENVLYKEVMGVNESVDLATVLKITKENSIDEVRELLGTPILDSTKYKEQYFDTFPYEFNGEDAVLVFDANSFSENGRLEVKFKDNQVLYWALKGTVPNKTREDFETEVKNLQQPLTEFSKKSNEETKENDGTKEISNLSFWRNGTERMNFHVYKFKDKNEITYYLRKAFDY